VEDRTMSETREPVLDHRSHNGQLWNVTMGEHGEWIRGDGTLQHPLRVELPPEYQAAPELLILLKEARDRLECGIVFNRVPLVERIAVAIAKAAKE
jgi:hypothetical protein